MVSMLSSSGEGRGFKPWPGQPKTLKLVFAASPLSTKHLGDRAKTGRPRVGIICLDKEENLTQRVSLYPMSGFSGV